MKVAETNGMRSQHDCDSDRIDGTARDNALPNGFQQLRPTSMLVRMSLASDRKRRADHFRQIDLAIRFREQQNVGVETPIMNHGVLRTAGRI
jgi:hypothetical protein